MEEREGGETDGGEMERRGRGEGRDNGREGERRGQNKRVNR